MMMFRRFSAVGLLLLAPLVSSGTHLRSMQAVAEADRWVLHTRRVHTMIGPYYGT